MKIKAKNVFLFLAVLLVVALLAMKLMPTGSAMVLQDELAKDLEADKSRFLPSNNVDIAMAMKLVTHGPPKIEHPAPGVPQLLLFPPSSDTLASMCGTESEL